MEEALHLSNVGSSAFHNPSLLILAKKHFVRIIGLAEILSPQTILEYLRLENLEGQHTQERIQIRKARLFFAKALMPPHLSMEENIIHRDIKPENSLVRSQRPHFMQNCPILAWGKRVLI